MVTDPRGKLPTRATQFAAGLDIFSGETLLLKSGQQLAVPTYLIIDLPDFTYGRLASRSGLALNHGIQVVGGVIDQDFKEPILCIMFNHSQTDYQISQGDRIAQLIIEKCSYLKPVQVDYIEKSNRKGFGSTGK